MRRSLTTVVLSGAVILSLGLSPRIGSIPHVQAVSRIASPSLSLSGTIEWVSARHGQSRMARDATTHYMDDPSVTITCPSNGADPAVSLPGWTEYTQAALTSSRTFMNAVVSFEIYDAQGNRVREMGSYAESLTLPAGTPVYPKVSWVIPTTQAPGTYTVKVLVFGPSWTPLYSTSYNCARFVVTGVPSTSTPRPTSSPVLLTSTPRPTSTVQSAKSTPRPIATPVVPPTGGGYADSSGQPMPVGDLPGWHQVFTDNFATDVPIGSFPGSVYSTKWSVYPDGWSDTSRHGRYYPSRVLSVHHGVLNYYIHTENGIHMVSAPEPKLPGASAGMGQLYGRYTVRFRADSLYGYKTAWLLWPDSEVWPRDGEIDFPEGDLNGTISAFEHYMWGKAGNDQNAFPTTTTYGSWHTATTEWTKGKLTFILDGRTIGITTTRVPNTPMHWVLQTETALDGSIPGATTAGNVQIDWVAIYAPRGA